MKFFHQIIAPSSHNFCYSLTLATILGIFPLSESAYSATFSSIGGTENFVEAGSASSITNEIAIATDLIAINTEEDFLLPTVAKTGAGILTGALSGGVKGAIVGGGTELFDSIVDIVGREREAGETGTLNFGIFASPGERITGVNLQLQGNYIVETEVLGSSSRIIRGRSEASVSGTAQLGSTKSTISFKPSSVEGPNVPSGQRNIFGRKEFKDSGNVLIPFEGKLNITLPEPVSQALFSTSVTVRAREGSAGGLGGATANDTYSAASLESIFVKVRTTPEPTSILSFLALGGLSVGLLRRRK